MKDFLFHRVHGTTNDFPLIHLPSAVGSLKVDKLHTTVFFFGVAKAGSGNEGFPIDGFYVRGSTVY